MYKYIERILCVRVYIYTCVGMCTYIHTHNTLAYLLVFCLHCELAFTLLQ